MSHPERAVARIDIGAVERNATLIKSRIGPDTELCAVVKANAYGHGDVWCAKAAQKGGATWLATAAASEAAELRHHGLDGPILVMGALTPEDAKLALESTADVVCWEPEFVRTVDERAAGDGVRGRAHVKLDTGMGRLGTKDEEQALRTAAAIADSKQLDLIGLMTHFATADWHDAHFRTQVEAIARFAERFRAEHPETIVHAANSPATFADPRAHFDMVRCGIALYGLDPFQEDAAARALEPALSLESYVAAVKRFEPGDSAGYGQRWRAEHPTWVATLPIGYGDGYRRAFTNNAEVLIRGRRYPVVGAVSMDNITVDLGLNTDVKPYDVAVVIGPQGDDRVSAEELAARIDSINYEITCALTARVRRVWSST